MVWHKRSTLPILLILCGACSTDSGDELAAQEAGAGSGGTGGGDSLSGTTGDGTPHGTTGAGDGSGGASDDTGTAPDDTGGESTDSTGEPACDEQTPVTLFLSPDDSNSMSSPVQAREAVMSEWSSLSAVPIRGWEFFNYYSFDYPAAQPGELGLSTALHRDPEALEGDYTLQIAISSEALADTDRAPINITLVLDTSGSMTGEPIALLAETCRAIAASLREGDVISMVTWNTTNAIILGGYHVTGPNDAMLLEKIDSITAGGGTDLHGGLVAGYELAQSAYNPERINRMVLISDGGANVGITDIDLIAAKAGGNNEDGIYMVGVGVGTPDTYHDALMDSVTDAGKGASVFVGSEAEAWSTFNANFVNTLAVAARDVHVKLDMPPGFELVTFSGEEYSTDPAEVEPQHLAPNDAMVFHQQVHTCAPELLSEQSEIVVTAQYKDAIGFEAREVSQTYTFGELLAADDPRLHKGAAIFAYVEALRAAKTNEDAAGAKSKALAAVARAEGLLPGDLDLAEIRMVLEAL